MESLGILDRVNMIKGVFLSETISYCIEESGAIWHREIGSFFCTWGHGLIDGEYGWL